MNKIEYFDLRKNHGVYKYISKIVAYGCFDETVCTAPLGQIDHLSILPLSYWYSSKEYDSKDNTISVFRTSLSSLSSLEIPEILNSYFYNVFL